MAITWSNVEAIAPELSAVNAGAQAIILTLVNTKLVDGDVWGDLADDGRTWLAAHIATVSGDGGAGAGAGPITSEGLGPMSRSYGWSGEYGALATTKYGFFYYQLLRIVTGPAVLVP